MEPVRFVARCEFDGTFTLLDETQDVVAAGLEESELGGQIADLIGEGDLELDELVRYIGDDGVSVRRHARRFLTAAETRLLGIVRELEETPRLGLD